MRDSVLQEVMDMEEDTQKDKFLTFSLGNEFYAIEIRYVTEIINKDSKRYGHCAE